MTNRDLIALINCVGTLQEIEFPITISFRLSQNLEKLLEAYRPYDTEYKKLVAKYEGPELNVKIAELQAIDVNVSLVKLPYVMLDEIINSPARISMLEFNIFKHTLFEETLQLVTEGGDPDVGTDQKA